jgi:cell division protein FtsZ
VQINFGVIMNESLGDVVKITVIATGFQPESVAIAERKRSTGDPVIRVQHRMPDPVPMPAPPPPAPVIEPEPEPEPVLVAEPEPVLDMDDLDTPAYLRQGRLLN